MGHALMENRSGLVVQAMLTQATGTAEREAAIAMLEQHAPGERRLTLAADKAYDVRGFTADLRRMCVTPHIARNDTIDRHGRQRSSSIDGRTTRHPGYAVSQRARKRIEEAFGWVKTVAGCAKAKLRGTRRVAFRFTFAMAAYNLIRMPRLLAEAA
jgi:hypothetical protein